MMNEDKPNGSRNRWPTALWLVVVVLSSWLLYRPVASFAFQSYWDDNLHVLNNPQLQPVTWDHVVRFWREPYGQLYIPVAYTAWAGITVLSQWLTTKPFDPGVFHAANGIIHAGACGLVYLLLLRLLRSGETGQLPVARVPAAAAAGALLFACHPLQVESVAWISSLRDVLGGFFGLLALLLFLSAGRRTEFRKAILWQVLATISYLLALGSKPGMVVVPPLALLLGWFWMRFPRKYLIVSLTPWFAVVLAWIYITGRAQPSADLAAHLVPIWMRPLVAADSLAFYLGKLIWPFPLCAEYGRAPNVVFASGEIYWTWIVPAMLTAVLSVFRPVRWALLPWAIFVTALAPMLGLVPFNFQYVSTVADRYVYLALVGPALALAIITLRIPGRWSLLVPCASLALAIPTRERMDVWADGEHLFADALRTHPQSWKAQQNYGCILDDLGNHEGGIEHLQESLRIRPDNAEANNDLGAAYAGAGRATDAIEALRRSLRIRPTFATVRNLVIMLLQTGQASEAVEEARRAEEILRISGNEAEAQAVRQQILSALPAR